jgi:hypothetical protein
MLLSPSLPELLLVVALSFLFLSFFLFSPFSPFSPSLLPLLSTFLVSSLIFPGMEGRGLREGDRRPYREESTGREQRRRTPLLP